MVPFFLQATPTIERVVDDQPVTEHFVVVGEIGGKAV
jgi:hypothetical protein